MRNIDHIAKTFDPAAEEARIYETWQASGAFTPDPHSAKKPFTIPMPPPNITGQLHYGHVLDLALQDAIIRHRRMSGYEALWLPGTDHAAIATEAKVVADLRERGIEKSSLTRESFLEHAWAWNEEYGGRIVEQLKRMGASCDWTRLAFTMDEHLSDAVRHVFVSLYNDGLIYRGERMINWCPHCATTISDAEVEHEAKDDHLYYVTYPWADGSEGGLTVATTRPETMFADVAVAVHPDDDRYRARVGQLVRLPLTERTIPVIADDYVSTEFGTGAVKITPGHDPNDFEVGLRHNLPVLTVLDDHSFLNDLTGVYEGLPVEKARRLVVADLEKEGVLVRSEALSHNVGHCYRCHTRIEPRVSMQWFVRMKPLAEPAIEAVRDGRVVFEPEHFAKTYFNWMENVRDWSISRQLWWGHRIPAWTCEACGEMTVAETAPTACPSCGSDRLEQDPDTLDTWFSSALWPFSTLGWPHDTDDYRYFYPTDLLVTGYDIIFFWVARMIFSGLYQTGQVPFHTVLIHGIVRDEQGRKMSKSLGNGIDPIDLIEKWGADALRYSVYANASKGMDQRASALKLEAGRNFINKIWNAFRFTAMNEGEEQLKAPLPEELEREDRWILTAYQELVAGVSEHMDRYDLNLALTKLYSFLWDLYCDWYIELVKGRLRGRDRSADVARFVLRDVLTGCLKMLHPFMPYFTEAIYGHLEQDGSLLIAAEWPSVDETLIFHDDFVVMERIMAIVRQVRNVRAEYKIGPKQELSLIVVSEEKAILRATAEAEDVFARLAGVTNLSLRGNDRDVPRQAAAATFDGGTCYVPLAAVIDVSAELARLEDEIVRADADVKKLLGKLGNEQFVTRAPEAVVEAEREKLRLAEEKRASLGKRREQLAAML